MPPYALGLCLSALLILTTLGCQPSKPATPSPTQTAVEAPAPAPRRIILMIGDGMGVPAVSAAAYAKGSALQMLQLRHAGLMRTHEHEFLTTDSAASATAYATGEKAHFEAVSVTPGTDVAHEEDAAHHLEHMVQVAKQAKWRTGLVATSRINHATPAAFAAHRSHRGRYEEIALDMSRSGVDVMLGGGSKFFTQRVDGQDLLATMRADGYTIATDAEQVREAVKTSSRVIGLLHDKDMPRVMTGERAMSLAQMTELAIKALDRDQPEGFFLMVEGSQIDWAEHALDGPWTVAETLDFDEAVGEARRYAAGRDDTLVIVTADHETGGLSVFDEGAIAASVKALGGVDAANARVGAPGEAPSPAAISTVALGEGELVPAEAVDRAMTLTFGYLSLASRPLWQQRGFLATHTAAMVPLFTQGPGAEAIAQVTDNADLGRTLRQLIAKQVVPAVVDAPSAEPPRNVILMIGDGMGVAPVTASYYARGASAMLSMPVRGLVSTHGLDRLVNDAASAATALSTGQRTRTGVLGMAPAEDGQLATARTVLEDAEARGLRTGLVSTTSLTHPTMAAFYAHAPDATRETQLLAQLLTLPTRLPNADGVDVVMAGGAARLDDTTRAALVAQEVTLETAWSDAPLVPHQRVMGLYAPDALDAAAARRASGPTLAAMTTRALGALAPAKAGFFLVVEGAGIDARQRALDRSGALLDEVAEFDEAVAAALAFAREREDTLVIVTANYDHSLSVLDNHYGFAKGQCGVVQGCGGEEVWQALPVASAAQIARGEGFADAALQGKSGTPQLYLQYAWPLQASASEVGRTAHFVPLFAYGPSARRFGGFHDQPKLGALLRAWASGASSR